MVEVAAKSPSVAAHLQQAGITAKQWNDNYLALWSAVLTAETLNDRAIDSVAPTAVQRANIIFLKDHLKKFKDLRATGLWINYYYEELYFGPKVMAELNHHP
jgi:hypothetical protein